MYRFAVDRDLLLHRQTTLGDHGKEYSLRLRDIFSWPIGIRYQLFFRGWCLDYTVLDRGVFTVALYIENIYSGTDHVIEKIPDNKFHA